MTHLLNNVANFDQIFYIFDYLDIEKKLSRIKILQHNCKSKIKGRHLCDIKQKRFTK